MFNVKNIKTGDFYYIKIESNNYVDNDYLKLKLESKIDNEWYKFDGIYSDIHVSQIFTTLIDLLKDFEHNYTLRLKHFEQTKKKLVKRIKDDFEKELKYELRIEKMKRLKE